MDEKSMISYDDLTLSPSISNVVQSDVNGLRTMSFHRQMTVNNGHSDYYQFKADDLSINLIWAIGNKGEFDGDKHESRGSAVQLPLRCTGDDCDLSKNNAYVFVLSRIIRNISLLSILLSVFFF